VQSYLFVFDTPARARNFVHRLALELRDVAIYVSHEHVHVIDGAPLNQRERILQLSRSSNAKQAVVKPDRLP
jgi:hypothetical protein